MTPILNAFLPLRRTCAALVSSLLLCAWAFAAPAPQSAYLLVHFTGEGSDGEQIYFATSTDGYHWRDLNDSKPVLTSSLGEKGLRDPSIIRSPKGDKFYIIATDLRIASGKGWDVAMHKGSTKIVIFESADLVNWSAPRIVDIAGAIPDAGCAWAPEAIYDETAGDYVVYWATIGPKDGITKPRIYYARTKDFVQFSPAQLYIDRPGKDGLIDTQIVKSEEPGSPYRYYRASGDGQITLEGSNAILGDWVRIGDLRSVGLTGKDVEGPILFRMSQTGEWGLWVDQYRKGAGYLALTSRDLSKADNFRIVDPARVAFGKNRKRHGAILNITADEYKAIHAKWPAAQP
jgi:hypothetical protein